MTDPMDRLLSALASRYTIERELGSGGMATVYLAHDVKHDRKVAVKVLRPELAAVIGAERFLNEIKVTANLQHPHILPLHDSGEADSFLYYVMPYVEGESLREKLNRETQLSIDDALTIATQVADALGSAHRQGVVHRDIKPENILLREGHAVVADFGIALAVTAAGGDRLTETGLSLGTPAYMSPEQVAGDREIDARSDIYSLACVFYEMLAGDPPFVASSPRAVLAKHVTDPAPPITTVRPSVSLPVAAAITQALSKAPADRFESAQAFSEGLYAEAKQAEPEIKSIVVLPFENLSPDPDQEYFSDGLTEEVISDLSMVRALRVISRSSAMTLKGSNKRIPEIAAELNVRYVLEGSVRKAGNDLRITAQLIDATSDAHLWADKYTGKLDDVFDLQEKVSRAIVDAMKVELDPVADRASIGRPISDAQAYDCFLLARQEIWRSTQESLDRAIQLLQNGLDIVGDNALLYSTMGHAYWSYINMGVDPDPLHLERAEECKVRALALDPESAMAHLLAGEICWKHGRMKECVRHMRMALERDRHNPDILLVLLYVYAFVGKSFAARPLLKDLLDVDPLTPLSQGIEGFVELFDGNFVRAVDPGRRIYEMDPKSDVALWLYTIFLAWNGRIDESPWNSEWAKTAEPESTVGAVCKFLNHAVTGQAEAAVRSLPPDIEQAARWDEQMSWEIAAGYALLDQPRAALDWLENAVNHGFLNYPFLNEYDPFLENIRGERRFKDLMERVKHEWENLDV